MRFAQESFDNYCWLVFFGSFVQSRSFVRLLVRSFVRLLACLPLSSLLPPPPPLLLLLVRSLARLRSLTQAL